MTLKMKLVPEISCLETQEKFWRGKLKEISFKFEEERKLLENHLSQMILENEKLKKELKLSRTHLQSCSVGVQTNAEIELNDKNKDLYDCKTDPLFTNFSELVLQGEKKTEKPIQEKEKNENNIEKTITKLFTSNGSLDSEMLAIKLVKLYEKRRNLVPGDVMDYEGCSMEEKPSINNNENEEIIMNNLSSHVNVNEENDVDISTEECDNMYTEKLASFDSPENFSKINRKRFLPIAWNIRVKFMKNFFKIKPTHEDTTKDKNKFKPISFQNHINSNKNCENKEKKLSIDATVSYSKNIIELEKKTNEENNKRCRLISAMKKAKSTGNIVKKVAFVDDLPPVKNASDSNLHQNPIPKTSLLAGSIFLHCDKFAKPIPAPRAEKNIIIKDNLNRYS